MSEKESVGKKRNLIIYGTITVVICIVMLIMLGFMVKRKNHLKAEIKSFETEILYKDSLNYKKNYIISTRMEMFGAAVKLIEELDGYTEEIIKIKIKTSKQFNKLSEQYNTLEDMKVQIKELVKINMSIVYNISLGTYEDSEIDKIYNGIIINEKQKERKKKLNELSF